MKSPIKMETNCKVEIQLFQEEIKTKKKRKSRNFQ